MANSCTQCGAELNENSAFCTKCGARRNVSMESTAPKRFCTKCGYPLLAESKICEKCGISASEAFAFSSSASSPITVPVQQVSPSAPNPGPALSPGSSKVLKFLMIVVALFMLFLIVVMGSCAYIAYRARQKAHAVEEAYKSGDANELAHALGINNSSSNNSGTAGPTSSSSSGAASSGTPNGSTEQSRQASDQAAGPATPSLPKADPVIPASATGNQTTDWALKYERTENGAEADLVVRTGDINNLGFGWPQGFDPFSGKSTPPHQWPDINNIPKGAPDGTDRIMIGSAVIPGPGDGYSGALGDCAMLKQMPAATGFESGCKRARDLTAPMPIVLKVGPLPSKIDAVVLQMFVDDFQPMPMHSHFQISLNGTRIPGFEYAINALDQSGPIGKLLTLKLLPEYWPLLKSDEVKLLIDDPTTHVPDGYAVDFVRVLVNPHEFKYAVSLNASVLDADKHTPISDATVVAGLDSTQTDKMGKCSIAGIPAGLVVATASAPGYDENSVSVDLPAGQAGQADILLHRHQEDTAALEKEVQQTGSATIYGIHFDTDSAKIRGDSVPALNAVLALINNHAGSTWVISGHTDNQGSAAHNMPLSEARATSVVNWLKEHGVKSAQLDPKGFGASRPVADNATPGGRALNRRVEVELAK